MKKVACRAFVFMFICFIFITSQALAKSSFKDVTNEFWAVKEIAFLSSEGVIKGFPDGNFKPNNVVTRKQAAVMLARSLRLDLESRPALSLKDVRPESDGYKEIVAVIDEGLFPNNESFKPADPLLRKDMAFALVEAYRLEGEYKGEIVDVQEKDLPYIRKLAANRITNIYEDGTFKPEFSVTRAQFSVFISRILNEEFKSKPFEQGEEYEAGTYDIEAVHPTDYNWNRISRFQGPMQAPEVEWIYPNGNNGPINSFSNSLVIGRDGTIYTASTEGELHAISPAGKKRWSYSFPRGETYLSSTPVIDRNGNILIGASRNWDEGKISAFCQGGECKEGGLFVFDQKGEMQWKLLFDEPVGQGSPSLLADGTILLGSGNYMSDEGRVYSINPVGFVNWSRDYWQELLPNEELNQSRGFSTSFPVKKNGVVFGHNVIFQTQGTVIGDSGFYSTLFSNPIIGNDGNFYYGTYTNHLVSINEKGELNWSVNLEDGQNGRISSNAVYLNGHIIIGSESGKLVSLNIEELIQSEYEVEYDYTTWEPLKPEYMVSEILKHPKSWEFQGERWINSVLADSNGTIYVAAGNPDGGEGFIYALNSSGKLLWEKETPFPAANLVIGKDGELYVTADYGIIKLK